MENRVPSDLDKGVTYGDPDGPDLFVDQLGIVVPTFIDPRNDLIIGSAKYYKRVSHHIPFKVRGFFKPSDWPEEYRKKLTQEAGGVDGWKVNSEGFVICAANKIYGKEVGQPCRSKAVNRTRFCRCHGGGLHPLDKKMSPKSVNITPPENRVKAMDRPAKFLQGFLTIDELTDEEVQGMFIYNDAGQKVSSMVLGMKLHQQLAQELHRRMNRFLQTKTASMLQVMVDIAESDLVEPADRIKAAQWVAERTLGKTPDVIIHGKTDAPYEAIFETIDAGSRSAYRQEITASRLAIDGKPDEIIDVEVDESEVDESEVDEDSDDWSDEQDSDDDSVERDDDEDRRAGVDNVEFSDDSGSDGNDGNLRAVDILQQRKEELDRAKEIKKARAKAKQRRFAARAVGATTTQDLPWLIQWKFMGNGTFLMKLVCPDDQTPARLDKIAVANDVAITAAEQWRMKNVS